MTVPIPSLILSHLYSQTPITRYSVGDTHCCCSRDDGTSATVLISSPNTSTLGPLDTGTLGPVGVSSMMTG